MFKNREVYMYTNRKPLFLIFLFILISVSGLSFSQESNAQAADLIIKNYQLVSKTRVGRTDYDYVFKANVVNNSTADTANVTATLTSLIPSTTVIDGFLSFGDVPTGATVQSSDTFKIRVNLTTPFNEANLKWDTTYDRLRIINVTPDSGLPGNTITIQLKGKIEGIPLEVVYADREISTSSVSGSPEAVTFNVPEGAKGGPLFVRQNNRSSNPVWFSVSEISTIIPDPKDVVLDELGNKVAVNLVLISMKDGFNTLAEAQRVASRVGGVIVGRIPLIAGYQVRLTTTTLLELQAVINEIKLDPAVSFVMKDQVIKDNAADWSKDPGQTNQRASNKVEEGAKLYTDNVSPTDSTKLHPLFTSIGILESGVDYDAGDFDDYGNDGAARSNNIAIYAKDVSGSATVEDHGTTVTGMIAAELGDGDQLLGKNAGLLQGLLDNHGGYNISIKSFWTGEGTWVSDVFTQTQSLLDDGVSVLNWSFGMHKPGTLQSNGIPVNNRLMSSEEDFNTQKIAFEKVFKTIEKEYPNAVIVAAAGNGNTSSLNMIPSGIVTDSMIAVGAHDNANTQAREWYSDYGSRVDISASGTVTQSNGDTGQGTSFAAPLVTATIASMQSINPDLTPNEIRTLLRNSALPIDNNEVILTNTSGEEIGKDVFTAPLINGKGARLNVEGAIQAAIDSLGSKTLPIGDPVDVTLEYGKGDVTVPVDVTVPLGTVFDKVDILFLVDVTGSYGDDINQFKSKAVALVNSFFSAGRDVQIGIATFADFPYSPYGSLSYGDYAYNLNQELTNNQIAVVSAINALYTRYGMDGPESQLEALYQSATGVGRAVAGRPYANVAPSSVGWRPGALPMIFLATDARFHNSDTETAYPGAGRTQTLSELKSRGIQVYGLQSGGNINDVISIATDTGGKAFTLSSNSTEIVNAVNTALEGASSKINIELVPNGDFADLVKSITPPDYKDVIAGQTKTFNVTFSSHSWLSSTTIEHVFAFRLLVKAEGVAIIMEIPVTIRVRS